MCGIFGFLGFQSQFPSQRDAVSALGSLAHRGPDAHGMFTRQEHGLVLGHARLSIIDPDVRSDQPFQSGPIVAVFNGEIYNFGILRLELERLGVHLRTRGDTEVIVEGFRRWGKALFSRLRGMYALAIYDMDARELYLCRDEFGIKPLCYLEEAGSIIFASEVKAIAALRSLSIEEGVLQDLMTWGFQMEDRSLYAGVRFLQPGSLMTFRLSSQGRVLAQREDVWLARDAYRAEAAECSDADLRKVIEESAEAHTIADVPVAIALSGGLDSSIVCAAAGRHHPGLHAFTFTLSEGTDAEVEHASILCRHLGMRHTVARLMPSGIEGWLRRVAWHLEEPVANINALLSFALSGVVRDHGFKVVLLGEGADELFGGYPWYRLAIDPTLTDARVIFQQYRRRRAQNRSLRYMRPSMVLAADQRAEAQEQAFARSVGATPLNAFLAFDQSTQLQYSQLLRVDRMFMAHGVEARVPFLYRSVLEASVGLPPARKIAAAAGVGRTEKIALAQAFRPGLPDQISNRPKFGEKGTVNLWDSWIAQAIAQEFERCLHGSSHRGARQLLDQYIDWEKVANLQLAPKEKFSLALLLEAVDCTLLSRAQPEPAALVKSETMTKNW